MAEQLALLAPAAPSIIRSAVFADDGQHRIRIERRWGDGPTVTFCCKNPSKAGADREDPSLHRMMFFGRRLGFGRLIVVNGDTLVATDPDDLYAWWRGLGTGECFGFRKRAIKTAIEAAQESDLFIAAWGSSPPDFATWYPIFRREIEARGVVVHHLGLNQDGSPRHPIARGRNRIPDGQQPIRWTL